MWNGQALQAAKEVILCEALIDAMSFWCAGYRNVVTAYGIEGFSDELLDAFKTHGTERVLIAYDRDDAGELAAARLGERLMALGIECFRIQFPKGMDANEYALKVTPAAKSFGLLIRKAFWMGKGATPARPTTLEPVVITMNASTAPSPASSLAAKEEREASLSLATSATSALPASPMPAAPSAPEVAAEVKDTEVVFAFGEGERARRWRVRGLAKNLGFESLKVNVLVGGRDDTGNDSFHVDTFDLYSARARGGFVAQAAIELRVVEDVIRADLGRVLLKLEALQEESVRKTLEPKSTEIAMAEGDREAALELLRSPDLLSRVLCDFEVCGVVGERTNKLVGYLA
ncbi:MAG: toprim domain-containing protein, partial [Burkholderiales bacterium]